MIEVHATAKHFLGMPAAEFLRDYWQKKPLLIRNAVPGYESPLQPEDLAGLAARTEGEEFITLAGRDVGLRCSQQILLVQVTTLHHVLQRLGGHRRTGKTECQQQRGGFHCELTHIYFSQIKK